MHHLSQVPAQLSGRKPRLVDADVLYLHLIALINSGNLAVAGILHSVALVPAQKLDQQMIQQLRPGAHNDLLRIHLHPPKLLQISRNGPPQLRGPVVRRRPQQLLVLLQEGLAHKPGPNGEGEVRRIHGPGGEIQKPSLLPFPSCLRRPRRLPALRRALHLRHKVAAALPCVDIPLRLQLLVGVFHRNGAHLQVLGQGPL